LGSLTVIILPDGFNKNFLFIHKYYFETLSTQIFFKIRLTKCLSRWLISEGVFSITRRWEVDKDDTNTNAKEADKERQAEMAGGMRNRPRKEPPKMSENKWALDGLGRTGED